LRTVQKPLSDGAQTTRKTVLDEGAERVPLNASGISGKVEHRSTEPKQEGFPEMSVSDEGLPEIPEDHSYQSRGNQIPNISGTLVNGTNRNNNERDHDDPDDDPGAWAQPLDTATPNGRIPFSDLDDIPIQ
jgi:hypothetical protein